MRSVTVRVPVTPETPPLGSDEAVRAVVAAEMGVNAADLAEVRLQRRSLDARKRRAPCWVLRCNVTLEGDPPQSGPDLRAIRPKRLTKAPKDFRPIIVGMGPAGTFAALQLADYGVQAIVLERGPRVDDRSHGVRDLRMKGALHEESNLCFGEGGAGTYSDGKLYSRTKSPRLKEVYERLVALGLTDRILIDAHPHVGTNRLISMSRLLRQHLQDAGHELRYGARVFDLVLDEARDEKRVVGVELDTGEVITGGPVLLATGHSARDIYLMLACHGVAMEAKPFAIGARVEHPQHLINEIQLGDMAGWRSVGAAEYFLSQKVAQPQGSRGVYSFCMCPGGIVLPTPTQQGHLNVNGMSNAGRNSRFANAALVAQIQADEMYVETPGDLDDHPRFGRHVADGALLGIALQSVLEERAYIAGGGDYRAPAQRLTDFVFNQSSSTLPAKTSYRPGLTHSDTQRCLPTRVVDALRRGASQVNRGQLRGYLTEEAVIIPVETTTSSPVRIVRGADGQSVSHAGLYPVAEGAGYAGGIVSSAIDGMNAAQRMLQTQGLLQL